MKWCRDGYALFATLITTAAISPASLRQRNWTTCRVTDVRATLKVFKTHVWKVLEREAKLKGMVLRNGGLEMYRFRYYKTRARISKTQKRILCDGGKRGAKVRLGVHFSWKSPLKTPASLVVHLWYWENSVFTKKLAAAKK